MPVGVWHNDLSLDKKEDREIEEFHVELIRNKDALQNLNSSTQRDTKTREDEPHDGLIITYARDYIQNNMGTGRSQVSPEQEDIMVNEYGL